MEFFKEINVQCWKTIQEFCQSKWDGQFTTSMSFVDDDLTYLGALIEPEIKNELGSDVKIKSAIMFINPPGFVQDMHIDGYNVKRINASNSALNLPILNCDTGPMMWYTGDYFLTESKHNTIKYLKLNWNTRPLLACTKIINKPTLVKINVPHHIENQSAMPRLMLSVRFTPDINLG